LFASGSLFCSSCRSSCKSLKQWLQQPHQHSVRDRLESCSAHNSALQGGAPSRIWARLSSQRIPRVVLRTKRPGAHSHRTSPQPSRMMFQTTPTMTSRVSLQVSKVATRTATPIITYHLHANIRHSAVRTLFVHHNPFPLPGHCSLAVPHFLTHPPTASVSTGCTFRIHPPQLFPTSCSGSPRSLLRTNGSHMDKNAQPYPYDRGPTQNVMDALFAVARGGHFPQGPYCGQSFTIRQSPSCQQ